MKCNKKTNLVCTYWEKCSDAQSCPNVPTGIRRKLKGEKNTLEIVKTTKNEN